MVNESDIIELWNSGKTRKEIAQILNVSIPTIAYRKAKINKELLKPQKFQDKEYKLTDILKLFIYGSLLGDFSISLSKHGKNAKFHLVHSAKSRLHFESIIYPYCVLSMHYKFIYNAEVQSVNSENSGKAILSL